jgi:hypothetical protein
MTQPTIAPQQTKLHAPVNNSDKSQIKHITRLKNLTNNHQWASKSQPPTSTLPAADTTLPTMATKVLKLDKPPFIPDIPTKPSRSSSAKPTKTDGLHPEKEDALYKKSPKRYHHNLKAAAGLQQGARDQPNLYTITDTNSGQITSHPQTILDTLRTNFEKEQSRVTPDTLPIPP